MMSSEYFDHFRTKEGIIGVIQLISNFIGAVIMFSSVVGDYTDDGKFYEFTAMTGLIIGILLILCHMIKLLPKNNRLLILIMLGYDAIFALFNLIAASIVIKWAKIYGELAGSIFFGYVACITYIMDAFLIIIKHRSGGSVDTSQPDGNGQAWTTQTPQPKY